MKDEIKEISERLEEAARKHTIEVCEDGSKIETMPASVVDELRLNNYSAKILFDYITNLKKYKSKCENAMELIHKAMLESDITGKGTLNLNLLLYILGCDDNV